MSIVLQSSGGGSVTLQEPATASNVTATLPASTGTVMVSGNMPAFSAYANASQTVTLGVATKVAIDTEVFDTNSNFDITTNRFTPTVAGYYQVNVALRGVVATTFTGVIGIIYKTGSEYTRTASNGTFTANAVFTQIMSELIYLNGTTDYLEFYGLVNGTGTASFNFGSALATSKFSASLVRAA